MMNAAEKPRRARFMATAGAIDPREPEGAARDEAPPESGIQSRNVLVALRSRCPHFSAVAIGRLIASAFRAPLHGLFVGPEPIDASEVPACVGVDPEALSGLVLDVVVSDDPAEALAAVTESRSTGFVVVPSAPEDLLDERFGVGSLAARALQHAACGVVVIRAGTAAPVLRRILLPLDGTPSTASAIAPAGELARKLGAELDIVMVCDAIRREERGPTAATPAATPEPGTMELPHYVDQPQHEWPAFTDEFLDRFLISIGHCPADITTRFFLGAGEPATEILRFARELGSDLLVLVWHGRLNGHHGATFRRLLCGAPCPVLVLRR